MLTPGPGSQVCLQATTTCCTSDYLRHDDTDTKVVISAINSDSSATTKADVTWIVRPSLADSNCVSLESANALAMCGTHPDHYSDFYQL